LLLTVMLPLTVAWFTLKELLSALVRPLLLALNCLPVPAMLTCSPAKVAVPLPDGSADVERGSAQERAGAGADAQGNQVTGAQADGRVIAERSRAT
jgi:hypothetical protein